MKKVVTYSIVIIQAALIIFVSCKKKEDKPVNPFDDPSLQAPAPTTNNYNPAPNSFEYLYENVFMPTCANSGCHDGSFEPDFRTIGSSYNSLVYAPVIITPTNNPYTYRVKPGNSSESLLYHRLVQYPGNGPGTLGQGRMPWNDTTWRFVPKNEANIANIKAWIDAGAKDVFGNDPELGNKQPNTLGLQITNTGSPNAFARPKYINISKNNGPVDIWAYVIDDVTAPQDMEVAEIKFSTNRYDFSNATTYTMSYDGSGNNYPDMSLSGNVQYNYKLTNFSVASIMPDTGYVFMRTYIKDPHHTEPSETPNNGSKYYSDYFVIRVTP